MDVVQGAEWFVLATLVCAVLACAYLALSAQPDINLPEERDENTDAQAAEMMVDLINNARRSLVIHDDGNNSPASVYNNDDVINALRARIERRPRLTVECLFNDHDDLKLLDLARDTGRIAIWYADGTRPDNDLHYKIVDGGKLVHLSSHAHGASERGYVLRKAEPWWAFATRRRISAQYRRHFARARAHAGRASLGTPSPQPRPSAT